MTSFYGEDRQVSLFMDEEENRISRANVDKWIFRLLLVLIGFMPLIVLAHVKEVISPHVTNIGLLTSGVKGDIFTYYKFIFILIVTIITGILLLIKIFFMNGTIRKTVLNYFLALFAIAVIISTISSPNISIALTGQYNRNDGAISWLCYIALMFIAMNIDYPKNAVNKVLYSLYPFVLINFIIITMNFTGNDLMQKEWVKKIVTAFMPEGAALSEGSQLVGTLNQWNYMSGMFAIMSMMFLAAAIIDKHWIRSIINMLVAIASIAVMLMSVSTSGFVTVLIMLIPLIMILYKVEKKLKGVFILLLFIIFSSITLHILSKEKPNVWNESIGFFVDYNPYIEEQQSVSKNTSSYEFSFVQNVYASENSFELPVLPERSWSAGTGRTYIWEKTLSILKERIFFGYGLDTLMYNFPHYNIDARAGMWNENTITDKPHNTYVGILYGTGIFGFIAIILIVVFAVINSIVTVIKYKNLQFIVFSVASLAYFIQAMFNDSLPGISGVIWVLLGIMFAFIFTEKEIEGTNN